MERPPTAVRRACRLGVQQYEEGLGGDGLERSTVAEARSLAAGEPPTEAKVRKAHRWWARNERFLDADKDTPADVAANLWGGSAGRDWFRRLHADLDEDSKSMEIIRKRYDLSAELAESGTLTGAAAVMGNVDRAGDVILPGAFKGVVADFVASGALLAGHDWAGAPIGLIESAKEVGPNLMATAKFHSTAAAQEYRQIAQERLEAGKTVGLSIGFSIAPDGFEVHSSGAELLKSAQSKGIDTSGWDEKGIKGHKDQVRAITKVSELYEFSIVTVPANPKATAREVKTAQEQFSEALEAFVSAIEREADIATLRGYVGDAQRQRLATAIDALEPLLKTADPAPGAGEDRPDDQPDDPERASRIAAKLARAESLTLG